MNTLADLLDAAAEGFQSGYEHAKAEGFLPEGILREGSAERVKVILASFRSQYGDLKLDSLPVVIMSDELVSKKLYDLVMAFEALYTADQATLKRAMEGALDQFQASA
jgi:hypothetical protein